VGGKTTADEPSGVIEAADNGAGEASAPITEELPDPAREVQLSPPSPSFPDGQTAPAHLRNPRPSPAPEDREPGQAAGLPPSAAHDPRWPRLSAYQGVLVKDDDTPLQEVLVGGKGRPGAPVVALWDGGAGLCTVTAAELRLTQRRLVVQRSYRPCRYDRAVAFNGPLPSSAECC
jgi:hypothetical protein